jgi:hypothetical protein
VSTITTNHIYQKLKRNNMKHKTSLLLAFALTISILSCKKETTVPGTDEIPVESLKIYRSIMAFEELVTNSTNLKSGEMIELDSAVWYTEALQNYYHARPDIAFENFMLFKTTHLLEIDNNSMISFLELQTLFNLMESNYEDELMEIPSSEKHLRFTDVAIDSIEGNNAYLSVTRVYGKDFPYGDWYTAFEDDDDWIWGTYTQHHGDPPKGKCDGTFIGVSDGSDELMRKLNNPTILYPYPYTFLITSLETKTIDGLHYEGFEGRLFVGQGSADDHCLNSTALNHYLTESHSIIHNEIEGFRPSGKSMKHVQINDDFYLNNGPYFHQYYVTYGVIIPLPFED